MKLYNQKLFPTKKSSNRYYFRCNSNISSALVRSEVIHSHDSNGKNIGIIYLSDKLKLNALTIDMARDFKQVVNDMKQKAISQEIRACIITGDGDAFSAGGDLNWLRERSLENTYKNSIIMYEFYNSFLCLREISCPTIAAINGSAVGAGLCLTLAADIRLTLSTAKLGFTFSKLGMHPGMGASLLLPRMISQQWATHLLYSGTLITGVESEKIGLTLKAYETKELLIEKAIELAQNYAKNSPIAVTGIMNTLRSQKVIKLVILRESNVSSTFIV